MSNFKMIEDPKIFDPTGIVIPEGIFMEKLPQARMDFYSTTSFLVVKLPYSEATFIR